MIETTQVDRDGKLVVGITTAVDRADQLLCYGMYATALDAVRLAAAEKAHYA